MFQIRKQLNDFLTQGLWGIDIGALSRPKAFLVKFLRLIYVGVREFSGGEMTLRAMSLVYTTLLSLVPLLAVSFSVLKAFGVHNQIEPFLLRFLAPLGPRGEEISRTIIGFVENLKVGVLGSLGLALLLYTVVSLIRKVEETFNYIWQVKRPRSFARKFSDYLSVILVGPVLVFSAIGMTATIMSNTLMQKLMSVEPLGTIVNFSGKLLPYLFVGAAFAFLYVFVPSTKVNLKSALVGGVFAGVLWESAGLAFASIIVTSTKHAAVYSGFAILILFMMWIYLNWLILLAGAKVAFFHQYPQFLNVRKESILLSSRLEEKLAFVIMHLIAVNYRDREGEYWTLASLVDRLKLPVEPVQEVLSQLEKKGLILESREDPPRYLPARDLETITLREVLDATRSPGGEARVIEERYLTLPVVDGLMQEIDQAIGSTLENRTLKELASLEKPLPDIDTVA